MEVLTVEWVVRMVDLGQTDGPLVSRSNATIGERVMILKLNESITTDIDYLVLIIRRPSLSLSPCWFFVCFSRLKCHLKL
jgi:hypothetical protein